MKSLKMRLAYVLLVSHYLQREERGVNHHVRRRTPGGKDEKGEYEEPTNLHDIWVGGSGNMQLDFISRHEVLQINNKTKVERVQLG